MHINPNSIKKLLNTKYMGREIVSFESIDSTNSYLKNLKNPQNGTLVIAESQLGGRGRLGRSFWSPSGGIYMSVFCNLPQQFDAGKITSCVALSVCKAIEKHTSLNPKIKWVNDIFLNGKKLGGILCEGITSPKTARIDSVVIGIGINVADNPVPDGLQNIVTNLNKEWGNISRNILIAEILNYLEMDLNFIDSDVFLKELKQRSAVLGKTIIVHSAEGDYQAVAHNLDTSGRLVVKKGEQTIVLSSGEVSISNIE